LKPPEAIDGAVVLYWAWSAPEPFFKMYSTKEDDPIAIHGLAVCRYPDSGAIYRFSCGSNWETENDLDFDSVEDALAAPSAHYEVKRVQWQRNPPAGSAGQ
jgi:hypothetical protein